MHFFLNYTFFKKWTFFQILKHCECPSYVCILYTLSHLVLVKIVRFLWFFFVKKAAALKVWTRGHALLKGGAPPSRRLLNVLQNLLILSPPHRQSHYIDGQSQLSHVCAACCPIPSQTLGCGSIMYVFELWVSKSWINYSSGLGGCTESCFSVLDLEQQGLSDDALKVVLDLIRSISCYSYILMISLDQ